MSRRNEYRPPPRDRERDWDRDRDRDRYDDRRQPARYGEHPGLNGSLDDYARGRGRDDRDSFRGGRGVRGGGYEQNYDRRDRRERDDRGGFDRHPRDRDYRNDRDRERPSARRRTPSPDARQRRHSRSPSSVSSSRRMQQSPPPSRKRSPSMASNPPTLPPQLHAPLSIKPPVASRPLSSSSSSAAPPPTRSPLEPGEATPTSASGHGNKPASDARNIAEEHSRKRQARRSTSVAASQSREPQGSREGQHEATQESKVQDDIPRRRSRSPVPLSQANQPSSSTSSQNAEPARRQEHDREPREIRIKQEQPSMRESDTQRLPESHGTRPSEGRSCYRPDERPRDGDREPARHQSHASAASREPRKMDIDESTPKGPRADRSGPRPSYDHNYTQPRYNNYNHDRRTDTYHGNRPNAFYKSDPPRSAVEMRTTDWSNIDAPKSEATSRSQDKPEKQGESAWGDADSPRQQTAPPSGNDQANGGDKAAVDSQDPWATQPEQTGHDAWGDQPVSKVEASWGSQPEQNNQDSWGSPANAHSQDNSAPWGEISGPSPTHTNRPYHGGRYNDSWPTDHQKPRHGPRQHGAGGYNGNRQSSISSTNTSWPHLPHQDNKAGYASPANASSHSNETKGRSSPVSSANTPGPHSARSGANQPSSFLNSQTTEWPSSEPRQNKQPPKQEVKLTPAQLAEKERKEAEEAAAIARAKARAEELARTHLLRITDLHQTYLEAAAASRKAVRELEMLEAEYEGTSLVCAILAKELEKPKDAIQA